jgi:Domain of unknown function (DUF6321)/Protein of unknown function (DUF5661)
MSWSNKYKRSIDCDNPHGFSQKAHCAARKKRQKGEETKSKSPFNEMHEVKSHKTVEQIAKKHRLDVSFIQKQLEMGIPIEHEHTRDKDLATDIALQHLDEIPDYYTRLKKMESDAKKHHKKFKDVKEERDGKSAKDPDYSLRDWFKGGGWVQAGGKYDGKPCAKQPGQTTKPFCRDPDDRAAMSKKERNRRAAKKRREDPNPNRKGKAKMVSASYEPQENMIEENCPICNLNPCQCLEGTIQEKKDACYHKVKSRYDVWPSAYASGALVKCRKVGAANWGTKSEAVEMVRYCPKCQKDETRDECKYGPKFWDMFSTPVRLTSNQMKYNIATVHPANEEKQYKDQEHSMARSELSTAIDAIRRLQKRMKGEGNIEAWVQSKITKAADYLDTAADYLDSGESDVDESVTIQDSEGNNYVEFIDIIKPEPLQPSKGLGSKITFKEENYSNWREELSEDWQKVNRQDKTDGLSQKAVDAYRREHPGSKLQTAVTEKKPKGKRAKRRANFCRRMKGMKSKLTSAKTARDPDSRINKALRRWNCN